MSQQNLWLASTAGTITIILLAIWSIPWKAWALWRSARRKDLAWFIVFTIVNTAGILDILYIFIFSKNKKEV
jgi:hypothetical protein